MKKLILLIVILGVLFSLKGALLGTYTKYKLRKVPEPIVSTITEWKHGSSTLYLCEKGASDIPNAYYRLRNESSDDLGGAIYFSEYGEVLYSLAFFSTPDETAPKVFPSCTVEIYKKL